MTRTSQATLTRTARKAMGAHYTPPALARFVAERIVAQFDLTNSRPVRILDPACGDGQLLEAVVEILDLHGVREWSVTGVETDPHALDEAKARLECRHNGSIHLVEGDFLDLVSEFHPQQEFWSAQPDAPSLGDEFDIVIANPPYVRTQVLGAAEAQRIAGRFNLSGRIDLYHAFILAMSDALRAGGILGIITSNRFMSTLAGKSVREFLGRQFDLLEVDDLGDTKLFEAAVLPAVIVGRRRKIGRLSRPYSVPFTKVYSRPGSPLGSCERCLDREGILEAVASGDEGLIQVPEGVFAITRGHFPIAPGTSEVWSLLSSGESEMLRGIRDNSDRTIAEIAYVRVGIKTTADEVFIRNDWSALPEDKQPESELLLPILRHEDAVRWALAERHVTTTRVLYPHVVAKTGRGVIDLDLYPNCRRYLETFRSRLEARRYVTEAGRKWYEIWVPQDPGAWRLPKIVFPDISPDSRFCLVYAEYVVNGDCYWMTLRPGVSEETIYLILGVANSRLMTLFHDASFNNKLYSGRRRYITQYVARYPLPRAGTAETKRVVSLGRELVEEAKGNPNRARIDELEKTLDIAVCRSFGIEPDGVLR